MGTRADFYVGKGLEAEWIGSIAWDGYRGGVDEAILFSKTEEEFRTNVKKFFEERDDVTLPEMGWPWPWDDSSISDCSYWFFAGKVWDEIEKCYFPCDTNVPDYDDEHEEYQKIPQKYERITFPNMKHLKNVTLGKRSGVTIFTGA